MQRSENKKIVFCGWKSKSTTGGVSSIFKSGGIGKMTAGYHGLHSSILLYQPSTTNQSEYPFHKHMPRSAHPRFSVESDYKGQTIICTEGRGKTERINPDVTSVDAYINFIPKLGETATFKNHTFDSISRDSSWEHGKMKFSQDPYEEAAEEYFEYRHGRPEERQPEVLISLPVKSPTQAGLDYDRMQLWWALVNKSNTVRYKYFSNNCAYATLMALKAGGADDYLKYTPGLLSPTPRKAANYTEKLSEHINGKHIDDTSLITYIKKLLEAIVRAKKSLTDNTESPIRDNYHYFEFIDINKKNPLYSYSDIKKIIKLLSKSKKTKQLDESLLYLKKAQDICAQFIFHHPNIHFNEIANLMISIDKVKEKNLTVWYDLDNPGAEELIQLKSFLAQQQEHARHQKLFNQNDKVKLISDFLVKYPKPTLAEIIELELSLKQLKSYRTLDSLVHEVAKAMRKEMK